MAMNDRRSTQSNSLHNVLSQQVSPAGQANRQRRHQTRMCKEHNAFLESKFQQSANWTKAEIHEMTHQLQIPYIKIYKWNWERKKKVLRD